jgi:hypothetical protein
LKTRYLKSNGQINIAVCAENAYNFNVQAHWKKVSERVEVTIFNPNNTACTGMLANKREAQNHHAFRLDAVPTGIKKTTTRTSRNGRLTELEAPGIPTIVIKEASSVRTIRVGN